MTEWQQRRLAEVCSRLRSGSNITSKDIQDTGEFLVFGGNGVRGYASKSNFSGECAIIGRQGAYCGNVRFFQGDAWMSEHAVVAQANSDNDSRFLAYLLSSMNLGRLSGQAAQPGLSVKVLAQQPLMLPTLTTQKRIALVIGLIDDLIDNNCRRVQVLQRISRAIYHEWFVQFRYPGHSDIPSVDSALGQIPARWDVDTVSSIATGDRNSIAGGPFGSKLGRKDYQPSGVPVLRGANLRVGGGFDESEFVYISDEKAAELRSAHAKRGDIVLTQRGTLGQIGRIPAESIFDVYVLSQSQMKVTVDEGRAEPTFVYMQLCSAETTQRFVAQAITTGVPHVNLGLLREFPIVIPPLDLQRAFSEATESLLELSAVLDRERARLTKMRDLLLPKLVTGQIDVSTLDLDGLIQGAVA